MFRPFFFLLGCFWLVFQSMNLFAANTFGLKTTSFTNNQRLPSLYTCDGEDISPAFIWKNSPANTKSFAFILSDIDAPGGIFYHWVLYNIPSNITSLGQGVLPDKNILVGKNSWQQTKYQGPCPPKGATHRYFFTLFALDTMLNIAPNAPVDDVLHAMQNHIIAKAQLSAQYRR